MHWAELTATLAAKRINLLNSPAPAHSPCLLHHPWYHPIKYEDITSYLGHNLTTSMDNTNIFHPIKSFLNRSDWRKLSS